MTQHEYLAVMIRAWEQCLSPNLLSRKEDEEVHSTLAHTLQNQYSEHAVWDMREALVRLVQFDIGMKNSLFNDGGAELLDHGAKGLPSLVDELVNGAVELSDGALRYEGLWGVQESLAFQHYRVLIRDRDQLGLFASVDQRELSREQRHALNDLVEHCESCIFNQLDVTGNRHFKARVRSLIKESLFTLDTDRAVAGLRSTMLLALRNKLKPGADFKSARELIERELALRASLDDYVFPMFWDELRYQHGRLVAGENTARKDLRGWTCSLERPRPREASAPTAD